jgi:hypothetical protein
VRRIGRYILNTLTVLSLVLCAGAVGLWVRSHGRVDRARWVRIVRDDAKFTEVSSSHGRLGFAIMSFSVPRAGDSGLPTGLGFSSHRTDGSDYFEPGLVEDFEDDLRRAGREAPSHGFLLAHPPPLPAVASRTLASVPHSFVVAVFAPCPISSLSMKLIRRRAKKGHCVKCGYDIRAIPDRCPECGTIPTKVKA